jgi:antitoxin component YwqK of YwqJK toxin-antitoxin module
MTNAYSIDDLVLREGLYYEKFTDKPFTGKLDEAQGRGALKDGKAEVPWVTYHDNGQLASAGAYKSGKPDLSEQSL